MNVYDLRSDCDHYSNLELVNEDQDWEVMYQFNGNPIAQDWKPLEVRLVSEEIVEQRPRGDFPHLFAAVPVLSRRAIDIMWPVLEGSGELLPLRGGDEEYFIFNVTNVVDALDETASGIVRFPNSNRILDIYRFEFRALQLEGVDIFKVPQELLGRTFVTDKVVKLGSKGGLLGFDFQRLWSST